MMKRTALAGAAALAVATGAAAQDASRKVKTAAFLETVATRGVACGHMKDWQAATLRALNIRDMANWPRERREAFIAAAEDQIAETACDDEAMTLWIDASRPGFEREMLPPYLVAYRTLAGYDDPPNVFTQTAVRLRYGSAVRRIDAKLEAIKASGARPEGGGSWPDYEARTASFVRGFVATLADDDADPADVAEAAGWIAQTAHVIELWLADEPE
ncbi:MAG: hypothetical protein ACFB00_04630 [Parvularculaceae bacterium]